ncbi:alpha/beta fold hydrolase [Actibacterium sp. D379-3]
MAGAMIWLAALLLLFALGWVLPERWRWPMNRAARADAPGRFADLTDGQTHYRWDGPVNGRVAVCVHGLTSGSYVWDGVVKILTLMGFRVLRYDLYGRGYSDRPGGAQNRAFFLRQLDDLLAHQNLAGVEMMLGYSMGASIAVAWAAAAPERVQRLVLLAPAGLGQMQGRLMRFMTRVPVLGDWVMRVFGGVILRRGIRRAQAPSAVEGIAQMQAEETYHRGYLAAVLSSQRHMLAEDLEPEHRRIARSGQPLLAIWGDADAVIPLSALGRLSQINRQARQVTVAGAGHGLPYTHVREIHAALQGFLREM